MTNKNNTTLYTGFTDNLVTRAYQHKKKTGRGFDTEIQLDQAGPL
jgi:predicted GIY-YIG superfamily endonuclease